MGVFWWFAQTLRRCLEWLDPTAFLCFEMPWLEWISPQYQMVFPSRAFVPGTAKLGTCLPFQWAVLWSPKRSTVTLADSGAHDSCRLYNVLLLFHSTAHTSSQVITLSTRLINDGLNKLLNHFFNMFHVWVPKPSSEFQGTLWDISRELCLDLQALCVWTGQAYILLGPNILWLWFVPRESVFCSGVSFLQHHKYCSVRVLMRDAWQL